jgi:elongin-A
MKYNGELWFEMIKRNIPHLEKYAVPEPSECSYEVYRDLLDRVEREVELDAERMKLAIERINQDRAEHKSKFVTDRRTVRLPKPRPTKKQKFALNDRRMGGIDPVYVSTMIDGRMTCVLEKPLLQPEKQKPKVFTVKRNKVLAIPTHRLMNKASQIKKAPRSLVEEHKHPLEPLRAKRQVLPKLAADEPSKSSDSSDLKIFGPSSASLLQSLETTPQALTLMKPQRSHAPNFTVTNKFSGPSSQLEPPKGEKRAALLPPSTHTTSPNPPSQQLDSNDSCIEARATSPPHAPVIRKRPAPNIFIQPKRRKVA